MNIKGVHHIVLKVSDPVKSKDFYTNVCQMSVFMEEGRAIGLTGAGLDSLWLVPPENGTKARAFNRRGDIGLDHWAFAIDSQADLEEIAQCLNKLGISMEDGGITDDGYGGAAIFACDPDGMVIEFHLAAQA